MYEKSCACKKSKKNFKFDIGPFFINMCCRDAGFNEKGIKAALVKEEPKMEEAQSVLPEVKEEQSKFEKKNKKSKK